ncbi:MAG: hypothetical protein WC959_03665 [Kiritimatiellales bacterium]
MQRKRNKGLLPLSIAVSVATAFLSGCTSPKTSKVHSGRLQTFGENNRITISGCSHSHATVSSATIFGGAIAHIIVTESTRKRDVEQQLNNECVQVIESVFTNSPAFTYVLRSEIGLPENIIKPDDDQYPSFHAKFGVGAFLEPKFYFMPKNGFDQTLCLYTVWKVVSPDGKLICQIKTRSDGYKMPGMTYSTADPKHKDEILRLAKESAEQFIQLWPAQQ